MKTSSNKIVVIALLILCIVSCDSKRIYDSYVAVSGESWERESQVTFSFKVNDTIGNNNLFITLRNNDDYGFSNLFLITELNFPNGKKVVDTLQYEMADETGKFLGSGLTEIKESKLYYKENMIFPNSGNYTIYIAHAMRKNGEVNGVNALEGITDVGFRIEKN